MCMFVRLCLCVNMYMHVDREICVYIFTYMYTYIRIHTHTNTACLHFFHLFFRSFLTATYGYNLYRFAANDVLQ